MLAARLRRGLSVSALAGAMGLNRRNVHRHGAGLFAPNDEHLRVAARALRFPESFFRGGDISELAPERVSFRSGSKLTARQRDMALGSAAVAVAFNQVIERLCTMPQPDFPNLSHRRAPEQAADFIRLKWHIDDGPIDSIMQLMESKGVRIFSLPTDAAEADSFSIWHQDRPFILLNTNKREDEQRFDLAHELGHLFLHRLQVPFGPKAQKTASTFATAFLMPAAAIRTEAESMTADHLLPLAEKWGVPALAIADRLHKLGLLTDWQYRALRIEIAMRDGGQESVPREHQEYSQLLPRVFASMRARGVTKHKIASTAHVYPKDVDELTFALALRCIDGAGGSIDHLRPKLAVVSPGA